MKYVLFRKARQAMKSPGMKFFWDGHPAYMDFADPNLGEEWKESLEAHPTATSRLEFVCEVDSPEAVTAAVRKAPLEKYVLFRGEMMTVEVAMPVFVDGKNLDTLEAEWPQHS